jgi:hypothetical protein
MNSRSARLGVTWVCFVLGSTINAWIYYFRRVALEDAGLKGHNSPYWPGNFDLWLRDWKTNDTSHLLYELAFLVVAVALSMLIERRR